MLRRELGQLLNLSVELIPEGKENRSQRAIAPVFITIHNTSNANAGADAAAHSRFVRDKGFYELNGRKHFVSWHYTVDDQQVIKHLPVNERAIHAGAGNGVSLAIEICMHAGIDQTAADLRAARLVAVLMHDLRIPASGVRPHQAWTGKNCPVLLLAGFDAFRQSCLAIVDAIEPDPVESEEAPEGTVTAGERDAIAAAGTIEADDGPPEEEPTHEHDLIAAEVASYAN